MDELKHKSQFNMDAANFLIEKNLYASSVHCSYYSCIQLAKHVLLNKLGITEQILKQNYTKPIGSHNIIREAIIKELKSRTNDRFKITQFNTKFGIVKQLREESDYHEVVIDSKKATDSVKHSTFINEILKTI